MNKHGTGLRVGTAARAAVLGLLLLGLAAQSYANTIVLTLAGNLSDYHSYTYTGVDGKTHDEYTGPYPAILSGGSYGDGGAAFVMCFDINLDAVVGKPYDGIFVLPTEEAEFEAAYLLNKLANLGGYNADVQTISGPIGMAIWQLMDPSSQNPAPFALDPAAASLVAEAQNAYLGGAWTETDAANYALWEPTPIDTTQRFGFVSGQAPPPSDIDPVPEPASAVLMAAGFGVVLALRRNR